MLLPFFIGSAQRKEPCLVIASFLTNELFWQYPMLGVRSLGRLGIGR